MSRSVTLPRTCCNCASARSHLCFGSDDLLFGRSCFQARQRRFGARLVGCRLCNDCLLSSGVEHKQYLLRLNCVAFCYEHVRHHTAAVHRQRRAACWHNAGFGNHALIGAHRRYGVGWMAVA
jgi:hypothetical protein